MSLFIKILAPVALIAAGAAWFITIPKTLPETTFDAIIGDAERGKLVFAAGGCGSCHAAEDATGEDKLLLAGGQRFPSPFGTFIAPNISSDAGYGIGSWSVLELGNALKHGTSPDGKHYFPAFPYTSYAYMTDADIADLWTYLKTLPPSSSPSHEHEVDFPFNIRRAVAGWKLLFMKPNWALDDPDFSPEIQRGRYLVEALGHCGECHTPRNFLGALDRTKWMAGAPNPSGKGTIPALTPDRLDWAESDIAYYLESGFTPAFDSAGGHMAKVVENTSQLPPEDRAAIAAYIKSLKVPVVEVSSGY